MAYDSVRTFENRIAEYCGSKYAISVSSCTNAIFLCLKYMETTKQNWSNVHIPKRTYVGVAMSILNAGKSIIWRDIEWHGDYWLHPLPIIDSALKFKKGMYVEDTLTCLSFHHRKHIPIGRGGMILTNDPDACGWLRMARFDGRMECQAKEQPVFVVRGYNMYLTPEQASRGLVLFDNIKNKSLPCIDDYDTYPDLSETMKGLL